jgi:hypothetical protein
MKDFTLISPAFSSDPFTNLPVINIGKDALQQGANRTDASDIGAHGERIATRYDIPLELIVLTLGLLTEGNDEPEIGFDPKTGEYLDEDLDVLRNQAHEFRFVWIPKMQISLKALATMASTCDLPGLIQLRNMLVAHDRDDLAWNFRLQPVPSRLAFLELKLRAVRDCWHQRISSAKETEGRNKLAFAIDMLEAAGCDYSVDEVAARASALLSPDLLDAIEMTPGNKLGRDSF